MQQVHKFWSQSKGLQRILAMFLLSCFAVSSSLYGQNDQSNAAHPRFVAGSNSLLVHDGSGFNPIWIKGINLGVGVPGTKVWELAATREDYDRWIPMMKEAGFNTIRVFTLHYPHFYDALRAYNLLYPDDPMYLMQGVWLEQELDGFDDDFYNLTTHFDQEIRENVSAVHGNAVISPRTIKAHGTYTSDVSDWTIGWIIGREMLPNEVVTTNQRNAENRSYTGDFLSILNVNPMEAWLVERMDRLITFESSVYQATRPVSFSNWPTLDPLSHPDEPNQDEDAVSVDISSIDQSRAPAGVFVSYHVYPWYPEFIDRDPRNHFVSDNFGINSYQGYLTRLREYYNGLALIVAEFGVPSSWGNAHYAPFSGMNYGAHTEAEQGEYGARLFKSIEASGSAGGIWFSWLDEWFKASWISQPLDFDAERRQLWHNRMSPEQNFGLLGYRKDEINWQLWESYGAESDVVNLYRSSDEAYFRIKLELKDSWSESDSLWISLDTFRPNLGEFELPSGQRTVFGSEFAIKITSDEALLYVKESYDIYGILHGLSSPEQLFRTSATTGHPWNLRRWVNNYPELEIQETGRLRVRDEDAPATSLDAVIIQDNTLELRLPWNLIHVTDPSSRRILNDNRNTAPFETAVTDGIVVGLFYRNFFNETSTRYLWQGWNSVSAQTEYQKDGWELISEQIKAINGSPVSNPHYDEISTALPFEVILYPNPTNDLVQLQSSSTIDKVEIYNLNGQLVQSIGPMQQHVRINLSGLSSGIYLVRVQNSDGIWNRKLTLLR